MARARLLAPVLAVSLLASGVGAPQAQAYSVSVDKDSDVCTITYTDSDKINVNNAYSGLFLRLAQEVRDSFESEKSKADAAIVYDYGIREDVKRASDPPIPATPPVNGAQLRLALGGEKDKYWQMVGFINASKKEVITRQTLTMTREEARKNGGVTYGVPLGDIAGGVIGGLFFGGEIADVRDAILNGAQKYAPEFAVPIALYAKSFKDCEEGKSTSSSIMPGSAMTSSQATGLGIAGLIVGLLSLVGIGFAMRPAIDQFMAQFAR
ncbi:hypothetical protein [Corynebacterium mayonis]|uniref:hypothetical protein n=1 Tax=Corynebacterium mayonis TaxID=3062461 RepID=UPI003140AE80